MLEKKLIVQFGRLDLNYREQISFSFEGEIGEADLTSSFLINTTLLNGASRLIIFPISIILRDELLHYDDPFCNKLKDVDIISYFKEPEILLKEHPHAAGAEMLAVSSLGTYSFRGQQYSFETSLDLITLQIYLYLATYCSSDNFSKIYIDVSSGLNVYIAALINAMYRFLPYIKFKRFLYAKNERVAAFLLSVSPIIAGQPKTTKNIDKSEFSAKAFNSFPYKNYQNIRPLITKVFRDEAYYKDLEKLLKSDYFLLHGALIYGAPLMLTLADYNVLNHLFEQVGAESIISLLKSFYARADFDFKTAKFSSLDVFAFTFALEIAKSIFFHFKEIIKNSKIDFSVVLTHSNNLSIVNDPVDNAFNLLHIIYGLPEPNYKGELRNYSKLILDEKVSEFMSLSELTKISKPEYKANRNFDSRNFFAHGGLEMNITELRTTDGKISLQYNSLMANDKRESIIKYMIK